MSHLRSFLRLSSSERSLLFKAALLLGGIGLGVKLLPFRTLRRLVDLLRSPAEEPATVEWFSVEKIAWAVELASRYVPATCLSRALAAQVLLTRRGHPALLHFGVAKEAGQFSAHAWLESEGQVVVGGHELERYTPLVVLGRRAP